MKRYLIVFVIGYIFLGNSCQHLKEKFNTNEINWSVKMTDAVMNRYNNLIEYNNPKAIKWQYDIAMLGQAIDRLGNIDGKYSKYHEQFIDYFISEDGTIKKYSMDEYNLDYVNPAKGLITIYKRTGKEKYLKAINTIVKQLTEQPRTKSGGYWHKKKYTNQMWLDGIYMSSPFMAQYAIEFNQSRWLDSVVNQMILIYGMTLDKEKGLLYHAWNESKEQRWSNPETGQSPCFWGRSMGWYMMALVDVLDFFPENFVKRDTLISILNNLSEALLKIRDHKTGLWYQVLDKGGEEGNYLEGSCSAMFTYAFAKGVKKKYLNDNYMNIANNSFNEMIKTFIFEDEDGMPSMRDICGGAGLGGKPYRNGSYNYYINEKKVKNDPKGVAPFIMAAIELGR